MLFWIIFGALAGWIASKIVGKDASMGAIANIATGIVGSFIGGFIASNVFGLGKVSGFNLYSVLIAVAGSVILLTVINKIQERR
ncbi:GlsB/YeaQ/YmgE family stress response membrane protein [Aedoeadaptatus coxii]|uniref:GlsB/YeaQ/YmgE family stress response membrane protein n=1 Tax=Aedoeadaptatus coxii TaxID=755172 RepID=UPI002AD3B85F|nr:GlsB/YeaQ/YmgE family stress response membrane protein [Peptoniphilus coxii]